MADCNHDQGSREIKIRTSDRFIRGGKEYYQEGWMYSTYCANPDCIKFLRTWYEWEDPKLVDYD